MAAQAQAEFRARRPKTANLAGNRQPLALHLANSMFLGDYLTSEGQAGGEDLAMIADAGFTVEGIGEQTLPRPGMTSSHCAAAAQELTCQQTPSISARQPGSHPSSDGLMAGCVARPHAC